MVFRWCLVRYLHPADHKSKVYKDFSRALDFKDIKISVKIRDIHKIEKRTVLTLVFLDMKARKNIQSKCQKIFSKDMLIYYL